jgi:hypothetical protein
MINKIIKKIKFELQLKNSNYYERISHKLFKTIYQHIIHNKLNLLTPITLQKENAKLTLAILANKKRFYESVATLYSFCFWESNIYVHYHEDGTLTENEINYLEKIFPGITIFRRAEQNLKVKNILLSKGLDHCVKLRDHFLFSIRSFDMLIEKKTPYLLQIDSDVLFYSKPNEILDIIKEKNLSGCFNKDIVNAYTFDEATICKYVPLPMVSNFNAGLFLHNFDETFFDFVDSVMAKEPQAATSWHLEQTLFAMYASYKGNFLGLPKNYDLGQKYKKAGNAVISEHYVQGTAYDFHKDFVYKIIPTYINSK